MGFDTIEITQVCIHCQIWFGYQYAPSWSLTFILNNCQSNKSKKWMWWIKLVIFGSKAHLQLRLSCSSIVLCDQRGGEGGYTLTHNGERGYGEGLNLLMQYLNSPLSKINSPSWTFLTLVLVLKIIIRWDSSDWKIVLGNLRSWVLLNGINT